MKQAAHEETKGLATAEEYFRHIRSRIRDAGLPEALRRRQSVSTPPPGRPKAR